MKGQRGHHMSEMERNPLGIEDFMESPGMTNNETRPAAAPKHHG